jgi:NAD(P)-dependent dehydrogenase (short-subunit alcohol dehydrogenase family)
MRSFKDKVAAITGAGSGIGRALALALAKAGSPLALSDVNGGTLEETAELARPSGVKVTTRILDVSDRAAVHAWADASAIDHGRVNLIFNNAGVSLVSTLEGISYEDFEWIMNINFWGVVHGTKAFLPHLRASGAGHIINVSSVFGLFSVPGHGAYNASKFAVRGFSEALRQELELMHAKVGVTTVHPGGIKTNIARASRISDNINALFPAATEMPRERMDRLFITSAAKAASVILRAVRRNQPRVLVGRDAVVLDALVRLLPSSYQRVTSAAVRRSFNSQ